MAYEVYLGNCSLYGVSSVEESAGRNVAEHDAIGLGMFTIPQSARLKSWNIKLELTQTDIGQQGWRKASAVIKELNSIRKSKSGKRLVIVSPQQTLSQLVLLRDMKLETNYQGAYSVTLALIEYAKASVKTTGVPSITRPGTAPEVPTVMRAESAYDNSKKSGDDDEDDDFEVPDSSIEYPLYNKNPAMENTVVQVIMEDANSVFLTEQQKEQIATGQSISAAYASYQ